MARDLKVSIIGDASSLERALRRAGGASSGFGSKLGGLVKMGSLAAGAAGLGGLALVLKSGISEWTESTRVTALTAAGIKSTGGVAHVTAQHVDDLASALLRKTGIDDEATRTGENMLLTFKNVRNETGAGNAVFDRATKSALDLSVRGFGSIGSASKMMGKALNDPIKGMTALSRAGVTFSQSQKDSIKSLVEHGHTLDAQKLILKEVESQVGGSAEAFGKTLPGQISILKESFNNLAGDLVAKMVPSFQAVVTYATKHLPEIQHVFEVAFTVVGDVIRTFIAAGKQLIAFYEQHRTAALAIAGVMAAVVLAFSSPIVIIAAVGTALIELYKRSQTFRTIVNEAFQAVHDKVEQVMPTIKAIISGVVTAVEAIWSRFGGALTSIAKTALDTIGRIFRDLGGVISGVVALIGDIIHGRWGAVWNDLKKIVSNALDALTALIRGEATIIWTAAVAIGKALIDGIVAGVSGLASSLRDKVTGMIHGALDGIKGAFGIHSPSEVTKKEIGQPLGEGVVEGMLEGTATLSSKLSDKLRAAIEAGRQLIDSKRQVFATAFGRLTAKVFSAFDAATAQNETPTERLLAQITDRRQMEDLRKALEDALTGGDPTAILRAQEDIQMVSLQKQAAEERQNYQSRRDNLRQSLEDRLATLQNHFAREGGTVGELTKGITRLLGSYDLDFATVGGLLGNAFVAGLKNAIGSAGKGATAIEKTIGNVAGTISVGHGVRGLASGGIVTRPTLSLIGESGPEAVVPLTGRSFGGGGTIVNVHVDGALLGSTVPEVAATIRRELLRIGDRNGKVGLA